MRRVSFLGEPKQNPLPQIIDCDLVFSITIFHASSSQVMNKTKIINKLMRGIVGAGLRTKHQKVNKSTRKQAIHNFKRRKTNTPIDSKIVSKLGLTKFGVPQLDMFTH